jgi:hypothetical protein
LKNSFLAILLDLCLVTLPFSPRSSLVLSDITVNISNNHRLFYSLPLTRHSFFDIHCTFTTTIPASIIIPQRQQKW